MSFLWSITNYHNQSGFKHHVFITPHSLWFGIFKHSSSGSSSQATIKVSAGLCFHLGAGPGTNSLPRSCRWLAGFISLQLQEGEFQFLYGSWPEYVHSPHRGPPLPAGWPVHSMTCGFFKASRREQRARLPIRQRLPIT